MDEKQQLNQQLNPLSIVTLKDEDGTEVDYTIDAIYFGGLTIDEVVGTVDDTKDDLTLHGLDKYIDSVVGTENDTVNDLTLNGLRKRIDSFEPMDDDDIAKILG